MSRTTPSLRPARTTSRGRRHAITGLLAAGALVLTGCGSSDSEESASGDSGSSEKADFGDLTLQLSWIKNAEFAGEFFADSKGYYTDAGFSKVALDPGPGPIETLVATGDADFGLSNAVATAQVVSEEEAPLKIVGTKFQKNPFTILSLKDGADITTPEDLVGKKIACRPAATRRCSTRCSRSTGSTRPTSPRCRWSTTRRRWSTARSTASWPT